MNSTHNTDSILTTVIQPGSTKLPSKNSVPAPFTGRHSKALKSSLGLNAEISFSKTFHAEGTPLLVSHQLLRSRDLGQIDLARVRKDRGGEWLLEIGEVKSSIIGSEMMIRGQRARLFGSQKFLSGIFGFPSRLIRLISEK